LENEILRWHFCRCGHEDEEFEEWTIPFFEQARQGRFTIVLSDVTLRELTPAPLHIRQLIETIPDPYLKLVFLAEEQGILAQHYIEEGAQTPKFESDAQHIAIATILKVESLVSWNFKHMVSFFRIKQYNLINFKFGYLTIDIRTPKEVTYGDEN